MSSALFIFSAALDIAHRLGIFAFIIVGLLDQSVIPLPGSMDALLIFYVASRPDLWWYYAIWATVGTTIGGFVTYHIARKGGKEAVEKKIGKKRAQRAYKIFEKWGFWSIVVSAILPPPVPIVPFLATAGVMQYPKKWFLTSYALGRIIRFSIVALITQQYGRSIFGFVSKYYKPAMYTLIVLCVIGGIFAIRFYRQLRRKKKAEDAGRTPEREAA
jgi:membrane protein YqaA with SNARE-associated domain